MSCSSGVEKVDVNARCDVQPTSAKLVLTKGAVIPADVTKAIGAAATVHLYATVCRAIVTAPSVSGGGAVNCPNALGRPGTAKVVFFADDHTIDTIKIGVTGCLVMRSELLGGLGSGANFRAATRAIRHAFGVTLKQFGGQ